MKEARGKKGILLFALLALTASLAVGACLTLGFTSGGLSIEGSARDPLASAKVAFADDDFARAERELQGKLASDPRDESACLLLAKVLLQEGQISQPAEIFSAILKEKPDHVTALLGMARCLERAGDRQPAIALLRRALEIRKEDPRILRELGLAEYRAGELSSALLSMRKSIKLDPRQEDLSKIVADVASRLHTRLEHAMEPPMPGSRPNPVGAMDPRGHGHTHDPSDPSRTPPRVGGPSR